MYFQLGINTTIGWDDGPCKKINCESVTYRTKFLKSNINRVLSIFQRATTPSWTSYSFLEIYFAQFSTAYFF